MRERYERAQAFLANLAEKSPDLPFEPSLLPELFASTADSSLKSVEHIGRLVERSQGLASRLLRVANSAYYGMQTEVSSLPRAVRLLGLNEIRNIILRLGIASAMARLPLPKTFPFEGIWEHQLFTAAIARGIALAVPRTESRTGQDISPDDVYAAGLLHDMGKTMLAAYCPEDWTAITDLAACEDIPFYQAEEDYWGLDHAVVGARLLSFWGLPARLTEIVNWHHAPEHAQAEFQGPARTLAAANLIAYNVCGAPENSLTTLPESVTEALLKGVDPGALQASIIANCNADKIRSMAKSPQG